MKKKLAVFTGLILILSVLLSPALSRASYAAGEADGSTDAFANVFTALFVIFIAAKLFQFLTIIALILKEWLKRSERKRDEEFERLTKARAEGKELSEKEKLFLAGMEHQRLVDENGGYRPTKESLLDPISEYPEKHDPGFNEKSVKAWASKLLVDYINLPYERDMRPIAGNLTPKMRDKCIKMLESEAGRRFESFSVRDVYIRGYYQKDGLDVIVIELKANVGRHFDIIGEDDYPEEVEYYEIDAVRRSGALTPETKFAETEKCSNCSSPLVLDVHGNCSFCGTAPEPREGEWAVCSIRSVFIENLSSDWRKPYKPKELQKKKRNKKVEAAWSNAKAIIISVLAILSFFIFVAAIFIGEKTGLDYLTPVMIFGMLGAWLVYGIVVIKLKEHREYAKPTPKEKLRPVEEYRAGIDPDFSPESTLEAFSDLFMKLKCRRSREELDKLYPLIDDDYFDQLSGQQDYLYISGTVTMRAESAEFRSKNLRGWFREDGLDHLVIEFIAETNLVGEKKNGKTLRKQGVIVVEWDVTRTEGVLTGRKPVVSLNCPNCGAPLTMERSGKCPYCDHEITVSEHDWLLSGERMLDTKSRIPKDKSK